CTVTSHSPLSSESWSPTWSCIGNTRVAPDDTGARGVGRGSCPLAFRLRFFLGRGLAIRPPQRGPRRALDRMPRRALPRRGRGARDRVLHPARVERRAPALLVVAGELKVVALTSHTHGALSDAVPRVQP